MNTEKKSDKINFIVFILKIVKNIRNLSLKYQLYLKLLVYLYSDCV